MDLGAIIALASISMAAVLIAAVVGGAWALGRQFERRVMLNGPDAVANKARLERIEHMLETLSTDVERISADRTPLLRRQG